MIEALPLPSPTTVVAGADHRQVRGAAAPRRRRDGRDLSRAHGRRARLRQARRHQAHPAASGAAQRLHRDVPRRGAHRHDAQPREHRADARGRRARQELLHGDGVPRRRDVRSIVRRIGKTRRGAAADRARARHRRRRRRRAALRAREERSRRQAARHRASRRHAAERDRHLRRRGQAARLRHRQGVQPDQRDALGQLQGQGALYVARAVPRRAARSPQRHLLARHPLARADACAGGCSAARPTSRS